MSVTYDDEVYDACLLQVVPDEVSGEDCEPIVRKLRAAVSIKHLGACKLTQFCGRRVYTQRLKTRPFSVRYFKYFINV